MHKERVLWILLWGVWENNFEWDTQKLLHLLSLQLSAIKG